MLSVGRSLACRRPTFIRIAKHFLHFVILTISNICFDNSMQWMNKMWIQYRYNVEKYNVDELHFPWKKSTLHFSCDLQLYNHVN